MCTFLGLSQRIAHYRRVRSSRKSSHRLTVAISLKGSEVTDRGWEVRTFKGPDCTRFLRCSPAADPPRSSPVARRWCGRHARETQPLIEDEGDPPWAPTLPTRTVARVCL